MIGIPFAFKEAGMIAGILLMIGMGILTDYSIRLLIRLGEVSGTTTYQALVYHYGGRSGYILLSFAQFMFPFFGMCAYSIIVGQMYPLVFTVLFGETALSDRHLVITLMSLFVMVPLAMKRDIAGLARWSLLAIFGIVFLAVVLIIGGTTVEQPVDRYVDPLCRRTGPTLLYLHPSPHCLPLRSYPSPARRACRSHSPFFCITKFSLFGFSLCACSSGH
jgi:sodium-coupled neutral amino acid transporter 11